MRKRTAEDTLDDPCNGGSAGALMGLVILQVRFLYDYSWFVGFVVALSVYFGLMTEAPKRRVQNGLAT